MKKVIALALAMVMALSMTAMAAPALDIDIDTTPATCSDSTGDDGRLLPGHEYHFEVGTGLPDIYEKDGKKIVDADKSVDSKYYSVKADWDEGSALVSSVKIDNDCNHIVVTLKENYTIEDLKALEGTITLKQKKDIYVKDTSGIVEWEKGIEYDLPFAKEVANNVVDIDGGDNRDDAEPVDVVNDTIYNVTSSGWFDFGGDGDRLSSVLVRMQEDEQIFAYWNEDPVEEIEDKYYDADADLEYVTFVANPKLNRKAEIAIQGDYSDEYHLYKIENGDIKEMEYDFNEDDGLFTFTETRLGSYVISDKELVAEADEPAEDDEPAADDTTTQNPDTGANDVVGVAVALAAVSLVAAGAVSLKK
ncbi:MAG TPA: hypothetical protein H9680_04170 [Firmicutes bacterium]|nr:hypothetical protein [Bacillota bacterium]